MINKLRRRIILINMLLIGMVIVGIFTVVNINNYQNSLHTLERGLNRLLERKNGGEFAPGNVLTPDEPLIMENKDGKREADGDMPMEITSYVIVTLNRDGGIEKLTSNNIPMEADELAICIGKARERSGMLADHGLMYVRHDNRGAQVSIAFTSCSSVYSSLQGSLLISGLLFAGGMAVIFVISLFLSGLAVKPVKTAWEQQKQFVADASHELKTPLTVILANNNIMLSHKNSTVADERQWLESTGEEANHMKKLIDNMLFLAKSDAGTAKIWFSEVNFSEIVEGCALNFEPVAFENDILIDADEIAQDVILRGDATQLKQLTHILTDNAVKYAAPGTTVTIRLTRHGDRAEFAVNNRGGVISREDIAHIFDRFYRAEKSRTTKGYGLGLSIARRIVTDMNGKISVESNEEDGTTFTVRFVIRSEK